MLEEPNIKLVKKKSASAASYALRIERGKIKGDIKIFKNDMWTDACAEDVMYAICHEYDHYAQHMFLTEEEMLKVNKNYNERDEEVPFIEKVNAFPSYYWAKRMRSTGYYKYRKTPVTEK